MELPSFPMDYSQIFPQMTFLRDTFPIFASASFIFFAILTVFNQRRLKNKNYEMSVYTEITGYLCSFLHAVIVCSLSIIGIYSINIDPCNSDELFKASSPYFELMGSFSLGYFLNDLFHLLFNSKLFSRETIMFIIHHLAFGSMIVWLISVNKYHYPAYFGMLTELSTIVVDIFQYCRFNAKYYTGKFKNVESNNPKLATFYNKLSYFIFFVFAFVFFEVRFVNIMRIITTFGSNILNDEPILFLFAAFILILNGIWMNYIIGVIKNFKEVPISLENKKEI